MKILINKIPLGFQAAFADGSGTHGYGQTWTEALGALLACNMPAFGVERMTYSKSPLTVEYRLTHGLSEEIKG